MDDVGSVADLSKVREGLDEIGESLENLKAKLASSFTVNETWQARGGQKETQVPMEVDHVSGSETEEEGW